MKIGDYGVEEVYSKTYGGILCGIHMDRDMATTKMVSHLLWIFDGIFDFGFYVGSRGPKWTKLSGSGLGTTCMMILRGFLRNPFGGHQSGIL